jgi:hypothetical protein
METVLGELHNTLNVVYLGVLTSQPTSAEVKKSWVYTFTPLTPSWCSA